MNAGCLLCKSGDLKPLRKYRTKSSEGREVFGRGGLHECPGCGLVQLVPLPGHDEVEKYYKHDYRNDGYAGSNVADLSMFPQDNLFFCNRGKSVTELLKRFLTDADRALRILDIGAGYGHILHFLGQEFPNASRCAIEFSEACAQHLQSQQIEVQSRPVEQVLSESKEKVDAVILSHVLEHLLDPVNVLGLIRTSLAPGGLLYVEVPNIPRTSILRYPDHMWAPRHDEPHVTFFSEPTLKMMGERAGFHLLFSSTSGPPYTYISRLRYKMPPFRSTVEAMMPRGLFAFLRSSEFTKSIRVQKKEESFFEYGGSDRIWIRTVWRKDADHT